MRLQKGKMKSDIFLTLSSHQWPPPPLPTAPSVSGSGFSLGDSNANSRPQSVADSRGFSPTFDDEMDIGMPDSGPSVQSEPSSTTVTGNIAIRNLFSAYCLCPLSHDRSATTIPLPSIFPKIWMFLVQVFHHSVHVFA